MYNLVLIYAALGLATHAINFRLLKRYERCPMPVCLVVWPIVLPAVYLIWLAQQPSQTSKSPQYWWRKP